MMSDQTIYELSQLGKLSLCKIIFLSTITSWQLALDANVLKNICAIISTYQLM